jgi:hypothetical protein
MKNSILKLVMGLCSFIIVATAAGAYADIKNHTTVGIMLGDPITATLKLPVMEKTFLNIHAGIWSWSFWHDIDYNTPFLSVDYALYLPVSSEYYQFYCGLGIAAFFHDNPKDPDDYDAAAAVRVPLGIEFIRSNRFRVGFELTPIYQFAPQYDAKPYYIELNGGLMIGYTFN